MPEKVYRSRAEAPTVLPFKPFTELMKLVHAVELDVVTKYDSVRLQRGGSVKLASEQIAIAGLCLDLECEPAQLGDAIEQHGVAASDVTFAVVGSEPKGGHLKRTDVLWSGGHGDLNETLEFQKRGAQRKPVLANSRDGYDIRFVAVLTGQASGPLMPRRVGTVLARADFRVLPIPHSSGMQPYDLTPEVRQVEGLRADAWILVKRTGELHKTDRLTDALEVYVDPKVLQLAALQPSSNRPFAESLFAIPALMQLVFQLSQDLTGDDEFEWDGTGSEALTLIQDTLNRSKTKLNHSELVTELRNNPARIAGMVSGFDGQKNRILASLQSDSEEVPDGVPGN